MQLYGCGINHPRCKEDCYWYGEWQDMNAHIPYCKCKNADFIEPKDCENCEQYHSKYKPTNADRIRAMSDEELAEYLAERSVAPSCTGKCHKDYEVYGELRTFCHNCWLDWLKQEVDDDSRGGKR